ncbi:hypothetical protein FA15DRAFT_701767 [Coprinopsis marcescibilis]|uniref:C2H2-type domain-containing protein n=1 Tax=Coprinopsis marcescibilis TaxID=230819 RepID=A0A5C3L4E2_COPMA|nr:hypothetical protein FA15DRAFT_701767 [Coprinopsis marcescibilis]
MPPTRHATGIRAAKTSSNRSIKANLAQNKNPLECELCGIMLSRIWDVPRHMKTHTNTKDYVCTWEGCDYRAVQKGNLKVHVRQKHTFETLLCPEEVCIHNFSTADPSSLTRHRRRKHGFVPQKRAKTREPNKRQPDDIIGTLEVEDGTISVDMNDDEAADDDALSNDMMVTNDALYNSSVYTAESPAILGLSNPMSPPIGQTTGAAATGSIQIINAGKNPLQCELCGIVLSRIWDVTRHMKTHTNTKDYVCTWEGCDYRAAQKGNLKVHIQVVCFAIARGNTDSSLGPMHPELDTVDGRPKWSVRYAKSALLQTGPAMEVHSKTKDFVCTREGCGYSFLNNDRLVAHVRQLHSIPCPEEDCEYAANDKDELNSHRTKRHGYVPRVSEPPCVASPKEPERQPNDITDMLEVEGGTESVDMNDDEATDDDSSSDDMSIDEVTDSDDEATDSDDDASSDDMCIDEVTSDVRGRSPS